MPGNGRFFLGNNGSLFEMRAMPGITFKSAHPEKPPHWDVFLSYTRRDREVAETFAHYLQRQGNNVYFDDWDENVTEDSSELVDYIRQELERSDQLAVLLTKNCQLSWWVPLEVGVSMEYKDSRQHITAYKEGQVEVPSYFSNVKPLPDLCR